ncbi:MAG TPA: carboxymuconolactone decarboxylase family protein [Chloroflexota bacterium]|nr:carboxymuconolactone decarboxylase family protein [Chloroflexota bacterium]
MSVTATREPISCRFPLVDPAAVNDSTVRAVFEEIEQELGFGIVPNLFRAMANQPAILRATWNLFRATVLQGELPRVIKEMVGIVVSAANGSEYALRVHMHSLGVQGVARETLALLAEGASRVTAVSPSMAAIVQLAHTAAHDGPLAVTETEYAAIEEAGITAGELAEVFAAIDLFQYVNSFTDLARVPVDAI